MKCLDVGMEHDPRAQNSPNRNSCTAMWEGSTHVTQLLGFHPCFAEKDHPIVTIFGSSSINMLVQSIVTSQCGANPPPPPLHTCAPGLQQMGWSITRNSIKVYTACLLVYSRSSPCLKIKNCQDISFGWNNYWTKVFWVVAVFLDPLFFSWRDKLELFYLSFCPSILVRLSI